LKLNIDLDSTQRYLRERGLDGWLLHDYRGNNPIFRHVLGRKIFTTRRCLLLIPARGEPSFLVHQLEASHFEPLDMGKETFTGQADFLQKLGQLLHGLRKVAMEYSPQGLLPAASWVDAGTIEIIKGLGLEVASSADIFQFAAARWGEKELQSHLSAAQKLWDAVQHLFASIGREASQGLTEYRVLQHAHRLFAEMGLVTDEGPIVAVNAHTGDPHYLPLPDGSATIERGDLVLIDIWAKEQKEGSVYADMTWVGYVGEPVPERYQEVFDVVKEARDASLAFIRQRFGEGKLVEGREVDRLARDIIAAAGYGDAFVHRLGHNIGHDVHGYGANLDDFETQDTRPLIPGLCFSIEPGIYRPDFGIRSEIDVYISEDGPQVTTPIQQEIYRILPTG